MIKTSRNTFRLVSTDINDEDFVSIMTDVFEERKMI